jgi:hypothetical protein
MSYLSTSGNLSVNTELLKDIKVNNEYYTLEFYYVEDEKPCLIMHFAQLEDAYKSLEFFKKKMLQAQLEECEND